MAYTDINGIHNPSPGGTPPATWGQAINDNFAWWYDEKPTCIVTRSTGGGVQSIPDTTLTRISWTGVEYDNYNMWSSGTDVIIPVTGYYLVTAYLALNVSTGGARRMARIWVNGGGAWLQDQSDHSDGGRWDACMSGLLPLTANDAVSLVAYHDAGTSINGSGRLSIVFYGT